MRICWTGIVAVTLLLAGCGKPDASGIYVLKSDNDAMLIQLVETPDGKVSGRMQSATIGSDGVVTNSSGNADGSVSGNELILRPTSFWLGGLQASGTFTGSTLTLTGQGGTVTAERSTLEDFDKALARLQSVAADRRAAVAGERFKLNQQNAKEQADRETLDRASRVSAAATRIDELTASMNETLAHSPDFGKLASDNTARIARMIQTAPSLSDVQRGQLSVAANQVEVGTNQIEVARSQYAIRLNNIVDDARVAANQIAGSCPTQMPATLSEPCAKAKSAATRFASAFQKGTASFKPEKQRVQIEIDRQNRMVAQIDG